MESDPRRCREGFLVEVVLQNGSLAVPRPGAHPVRPLAYSALVDEDNRAPLGLGFFKMAGPSSPRLRPMPSSFRSRARPTGLREDESWADTSFPGNPHMCRPHSSLLAS